MVSEIMARKKEFMAFGQKQNHQLIGQVSVTSISHAAHVFLKKQYRWAAYYLSVITPFGYIEAVMRHHRTNAGLAFLASPVENYPGLFGRRYLVRN